MGRRRRGGGRPFGEDPIRQPRHKDDSRLAINTYEDVPDSEDEFHIQRDEIRLNEGPAAKRLRRAQEKEAELELSDEEILAVSEEDEQEDVDDDLDDGIDEDIEEKDILNLKSAKPQLQKARSKRNKLGRPLQDSESEDGQGQEEEIDERWGTSRKDYYNADVNETEQDALAEEAEARRLQQKQMQGMTDADYGLDLIDWASEEASAETGKGSKTIAEVLPKLQITESMGPEERMNILRMRYPEFEPLAKEFVDLQEVFKELQERSRDFDTTLSRDFSMPTVTLKQRTLAAYLSAISMYFVLLTSATQTSASNPTPMPPEELQNHSVMGTLVECRDLWARVQNLSETKDLSQLTSGEANGHADEAAVSVVQPGLFEKNHSSETNGLAEKRQKVRKTQAEKALARKIREEENRRKAQMDATEASLADLSALTVAPKPRLKSTKNKTVARSDSGFDIGEQTNLTAAELAEKARRKKTLRFYTSQIAQKSNKRNAAGRDAGGDDDLPYRERWKEKQARLQAEAEKRGKQAKLPGADLGGSDASEDDTTNMMREELTIPDAQGDDDYYDFVAAQSRKKKADKAARATGNGTIDRINDEGELDDDGRRNISYEIEKNKGLMNKRKKDQRNPRVKKRKKFDEKKKKLASMKPVYKGGEGRGGYGGELTGIKKGLVKGVKLS